MTDLAVIRERHQPKRGWHPDNPSHSRGRWADLCSLDAQPWPCDVALLLAESPVPADRDADIARIEGIAAAIRETGMPNFADILIESLAGLRSPVPDVPETAGIDGAAEHQPGDSHDYRIECTVCGERGMIRLSVDPGRFGERQAIAAGTHKPAVDDFGNQYLHRLLASQPVSEEPES